MAGKIIFYFKGVDSAIAEKSYMNLFQMQEILFCI